MKLKAGDWVEVRSPAEIAATLDTAGTLDGMPFMPEMLSYTGKRFQVLRLAEKSCVEFPNRYFIRRFRGGPVVILRGARCSGLEHDGCGRACVMFWKPAWLRPAGGPQPGAPAAPTSGALISRLRVKSSAQRYFCQSTGMAAATEPLTRGDILRLCASEIRSRSRGVFEMIGLTVMPLWRKATSRIPRRRLAGSLTRTPTEALGLQPGELVEIRPAAEIAATLDKNGKNRGLTCDFGMCQYSGGTYRVRNRLDRMISEPTGEMKEVKNTVVLEGLYCLCWNVFGGCPRSDHMYWREIWLKRAAGPPLSL